MLRLIDGRAVLVRYKAEWEQMCVIYDENENAVLLDDGGVATKSILKTEYFVSMERIIEYAGDNIDNFTITEVNQTGNEWIEGLEFNSREKAVEALEMGEEAYNKLQHAPTVNARVEAIEEAIFELAGEIYG